MIIWGGDDLAAVLNTGGKYNPSTDSWTPTTTTNAPDARAGHTAVWTGSEMIIWGGGLGIFFFNTAGGQNPSRDRWTPTTTVTHAPAPSTANRSLARRRNERLERSWG